MEVAMNWRAQEENCLEGSLIDALFNVLPQIDAAKEKLRQIDSRNARQRAAESWHHAAEQWHAEKKE
jgi:hypothetical protein